MGIEIPLVLFKPPEIQVLANRLRFAEGQPFEFRPRSRIVQELVSSKEGFKNPIT